MLSKKALRTVLVLLALLASPALLLVTQSAQGARVPPTRDRGSFGILSVSPARSLSVGRDAKLTAKGGIAVEQVAGDWVAIVDDDFTSDSGNWIILSNATTALSSGFLRLIDDEANTYAAAVLRENVTSDDLEIIVRYNVTAGASGLDGGLAVVFYATEISPSSDYYLGYWNGSVVACAVELDFEENAEVGDPATPHVAIVVNGTKHASWYGMDASGVHELRIRVVLGAVMVFLDGNPVAGASLGLRPYGAKFAVTASTGDAGGIYLLDRVTVRERVSGRFSEVVSEDFDGQPANLTQRTNYGNIWFEDGEAVLVPTTDGIPELAESRGFDKALVRSFLESQYVPEAGLLRAATAAYPDNETIWISSDNLLAAYALKVLESPYAEYVIRNVQQNYSNAFDYKHEVLFGVPIPSDIGSANVYVLGTVYSSKFGDTFTVKQEVSNGTPVNDWNKYADLVVYKGLNSLISGDRDTAESLFQTLMNMWDGYGFNDSPTQETGIYATYKTALAVFFYRALKASGSAVPDSYWSVIDKCIDIVISAIRSDGGVRTDYKVVDDNIVIQGDANTETTSIAVLSLVSNIPVAVGTGLYGQLWFDTPVSEELAVDIRFRVEMLREDVADGIVVMFYKDKNYAPAAGGSLGFSPATGGAPGWGVEFDYYPTQGLDRYPREIALLKDTASDSVGATFASLWSLNGSWTQDSALCLPRDYTGVDEGDFEYVTARVIVDRTYDGYYELAVLVNHSALGSKLVLYARNQTLSKPAEWLGISAGTGGVFSRVKVDRVRIWVRDVTPPSLTLTSYPQSTVNTENVTISWRAEDDWGVDHYEVSVDGGEWINVGLSESYTFSLPDGSHTVAIRAYDGGGNYDEKVVALQVDTTPPTISDGRSPDAPEYDDAVTIYANVTDSESGVDVVLLNYSAGGGWVAVPMSFNGTYWVAEIGPFPYGTTIEYAIFANDTAGNANTTAVRTFTVADFTPPDIVSFTVSPAQPEYYDVLDVSVLPSEPENASGVAFAVLLYSFNQTVWYSVNMTASGSTWRVEIGPFRYNTTVYIKVRVYDRAGNYAETAVVERTISDTVPPELEVTQSPPHPEYSSEVVIAINATEPVNASGVNSVLLEYSTGDAWQNVTLQFNGTHWIGVIPALPYGTSVTYKVVVYDVAGNVATHESTYTVGDYEPPEASAIETPGAVEYDETVRFSLTAYEPANASGVGTVYVEIDRNGYITRINMSWNGTCWVAEVHGMPWGNATYRYVVFDNAGNYRVLGPYSLRVTDSRPPEILSFTNTTLPLYDKPLSLRAIVLEPENASGVSEVLLVVTVHNSTEELRMSPVGGGCYEASIGPYSYGTTITVRVVAIDRAGNEISSADLTLTVLDRTPPRIEALFQNFTYDECVVIVAEVMDDPNASGLASVYGVVRTPSGSRTVFPEFNGTHYVFELGLWRYGTKLVLEIHAADHAGNEASVSGTIVIEDREPPEITSVTYEFFERDGSTFLAVYASVREPENASGVGQVFLYVRFYTGWTKIPMSLKGDRWVAAVKISGETDFYVEAVDRAGNVAKSEIMHAKYEGRKGATWVYVAIAISVPVAAAGVAVARGKLPIPSRRLKGGRRTGH